MRICKSLGRLHTVDEALRRASRSRARTFERFSFDLIYARPAPDGGRLAGTSLAKRWRSRGGHLSLYQLTIEPETPFAALHAAGKLVVPEARRRSRSTR